MRIIAEIEQLLASSDTRVIIGFAGPPAAGKSTLARALVTLFGDQAGYVPLDGFHLSNSVLSSLGLSGRKGAPETFDVLGYRVLLARLAAEFTKNDVYCPEYDRGLHEPIAARSVVSATTRLIITEGNYLGLPTGEWRDISPRLTRWYYVDAPETSRAERLIARHIAGGRTPAAAREWYSAVDRPNAELIATSKSRAYRTVDEDEVAGVLSLAQPLPGAERPD
ncbi:nucleoside/nucleotide kinase family protein [Skermania sp. ID1734]|uniref:nucleoside/nucleotide kinase family protein n=1 Tax=Skermania sp. ID1734 TaxID=2597516 RepID=UPI00163D9FC6|nr:nucleoside/nucleotide kinase family protein [Skermania sp. ID1734]